MIQMLLYKSETKTHSYIFTNSSKTHRGHSTVKKKQPVNYEMLKLPVRINNQLQHSQGRTTKTPRASAAPHLFFTNNIWFTIKMCS